MLKKNHPSIIAIKNARNGPAFCFGRLSINVFEEIKRLKVRKATQSTDIPVKILEENAYIFSANICDFLNKTIRSGTFPAILKNGDITAVFKKGFKQGTPRFLNFKIKEKQGDSRRNFQIFNEKFEKNK